MRRTRLVRAGISFLLVLLVGPALATEGTTQDGPAEDPTPAPAIVLEQEVPLLQDAPSRKRRRLGGGLRRETDPSPWILLPDTYPLGSREFELFILGYIKLDGLHDFEANGLGPGFPTHFLPAQIPPRGSPAAANRGRSSFTANSSRMEIGGWTSTPVGRSGILFDFDFERKLTGRPAFLVRQFYMEVGDLRVGQSWTTFINLDAIPDTLDYEGANALPEVRQGLVRWTQPATQLGLGEIPFVQDLSIAIAAEQPDNQLTLPPGVQPRNRFPDFVGNLQWRRGKSSIWISGLYRRLEARRSNLHVAGNGWGVQFTGNLEFDPLPYIQFGLIYGEGIGRYIQDTDGLDLDGVVSPSGRLKLFPALSAWVGIQHWWSMNWRSTVSYGYVRVSDNEIAAPTGDPNGIYKMSHYASANLIYSPLPPVDIGVEYLFGYRRTNDGRHGLDNRIQVSLILHFASGPEARDGGGLLDRFLGRAPKPGGN